MNKKKLIMRFLVILSLTLFVLCTYGLCKNFIPKPNYVQKNTSQEAEGAFERYILGKVTTNDVAPGLIPVLIYRFSPLTGEASVAGSGAIFSSSNGMQMLTSAHVFSIRNNGPTNQYCVRKLRPLEGHIVDFGIESISPDDKNILNYREVGNDAVLCNVSPISKPIVSFYTEERENMEVHGEFRLRPLEEATCVRSVLTGEDIPVVGRRISNKTNGLQISVIIYATRTGESGTVFIDTAGNRYVLKGSNDNWNNISETEKKLGYPLGSSYSVIVGPMHP